MIAAIATAALTIGFLLPLHAWSLLKCIRQMKSMPDRKKLSAWTERVSATLSASVLLVILMGKSDNEITQGSDDVIYSTQTDVNIVKACTWVELVVESTFYLPFAVSSDHGLFGGTVGLNNFMEKFFVEYAWTRPTITPAWARFFINISGFGQLAAVFGVIFSFVYGGCESTPESVMNAGRLSFLLGFLVFIIAPVYWRCDMWSFKRNGPLQRKFFMIFGTLVIQLPLTFIEYGCNAEAPAILWILRLVQVASILEEKTFEEGSCMYWLEQPGFPAWMPNWLTSTFGIDVDVAAVEQDRTGDDVA